MGGLSGEVRGHLPKPNFLVFDGENPKLWIRRSQDYFDMYPVEPQLWVRVAYMNFVGVAARWLSSLEESSRGWVGTSFVACCWNVLARMNMRRSFANYSVFGRLLQWPSMWISSRS
jgi:hypothetical protein